MTEDKLNSLFDEIRNESAQTSVSEVDQWIDAAVATAATVGLLTTLKLFLIKKPLIMWTTFLTLAGGASLSAVMIFSQPEKMKEPADKPSVNRSFYGGKEESKRAENTESEKPIQLPEPGSSNGPEDLGIYIPVRTPDFDGNPIKPVFSKAQTSDSFTRIHVSGAIYIELTQGKSCSAQVDPESEKDKIRIEIKNGTLFLSNEPDVKQQRTGRVVVKVSVEKLEKLEMSGATNLVTINELGGELLILDLTGASNVNMKLKVSKLKADFSGASNGEINGSCEDLVVDMSGAAHINMSGMETKNAQVDNSGAGHLELNISTVLVIDASGASQTIYQITSDSSNASTDVETSGSATVIKRK